MHLKDLLLIQGISANADSFSTTHANAGHQSIARRHSNSCPSTCQETGCQQPCHTKQQRDPN
jgi:hypothetical protein